MTSTLHIEHPITDLATWEGAFARFAQARTEAGVLGARVSQPVGDSRYVVVDLDFPTSEQANRFLTFLRERVWADRASSPALAGEPRALVLEPVEQNGRRG